MKVRVYNHDITLFTLKNIIMTLDFPVVAEGKWLRQCVGIDISKDKFTACIYLYDIGSDMGNYSKTVEFTNDKKGFNQFVKWSRKEAYKDCPLTYLMEPTGVYYEPLAYHLSKINQTVYVVLPNKARDFCNYEGIKTKTDEMDARCLALLGCTNRKLQPWQPPKPVYRELRQMTRFNEDISKVRTELANHLEALNHSENAEPAVIKYYNKLISDIDKQLADNEKNILKKVSLDKDLSEKVERLNTIKGIGIISIITIIAETNGFALIRNRKQLASYAGLDVIAKQSGTEDPKHVISKKGNAHIRRVLFFPGIVSAHSNPQAKDMYTRICAKNPKVKMIGVVASMRKLLLLVYTLWKSGEEYDPERTTTSTPRKKTDDRIVDEDGRLLVNPDEAKSGCKHQPTATRDSTKLSL